jgi:integrase
VALDAETPKIAALFRLLLLTAQRKGEVAGMRWGEIDFESAWWTIPKERSKNGLAHRVPLAPTAISILRGLHKDRAVGPVFPGSIAGQPLNNIAKPLRRLIKRSQVQFRIHDLRRTAATCMTSHSIPRLTVAKLLNHVERDITSTYDRASYDVEKRNALSRWEAVMAAILSGKPAKIVPFHAA